MTIDDDRDRTVTYRTDLSGVITRRDEQDSLSGGDPHEVWRRFAGREIDTSATRAATTPTMPHRSSPGDRP